MDMAWQVMGEVIRKHFHLIKSEANLRMRHRTWYLIGFVLGVVGLGLVLSAHPQGAKHVFQQVAPSVVALIMADDNRQPSALGSGFVVGDELIVTNFHVIRGAAAGRVKLVGDEKLFLIEGVVGADAKRDVAILRVPGLKALALPLLQAARVAVGDGVFALGNPRGLGGKLFPGNSQRHSADRRYNTFPDNCSDFSGE
jgi:S1-C subfamily serine protease